MLLIPHFTLRERATLSDQRCSSGGCPAELCVGYTYLGGSAGKSSNACCCAAEALCFLRVDAGGVAEQSGHGLGGGLSVRHAAFLRFLIAGWSIHLLAHAASSFAAGSSRAAMVRA